MDLLSLLSSAWRFRYATLAVVLATIGLGAAVVYLRPPTYQGTSSYLLIEPPEAPTEAQIEENPKLAEIQADNPFVRYDDTSVIINVVARRVATSEVAEEVVDAGGDADFEVTPSRRFGAASPIIDISSSADSEEAMFATLDFLDDAVTEQLAVVQAEEDVDPDYMFTVRQVEYPEFATRNVSSTLRIVVGVVALGTFALILVLATLRGRASRRTPAGSTPRPDQARKNVGTGR